METPKLWNLFCCKMLANIFYRSVLNENKMHRTVCGKVFLMQNLEEICFTDDTQSERMRDTNARNFVKNPETWILNILFAGTTCEICIEDVVGFLVEILNLTHCTCSNVKENLKKIIITELKFHKIDGMKWKIKFSWVNLLEKQTHVFLSS